MDLLSQSSLLVGITSFALGFSVLARNVRNKLYLSYALLCTVIAGWAIAFFLERIWGDQITDGTFYRLHLLFNLWIAPAGLFLIRVMVRIQDRLSRRLLDLAVLGALGLSIALALNYDQDPLVLEVLYFFPGVILLQVLQLMWIDRALSRGIRRRKKAPTVGFARRNLIYVGALAVLCTSTMDHVPWDRIWGGEWGQRLIPVFGNLGLTAYLFFLSRAVTQQRLLNFGALFSRFMVLLVIALTLTGVYSMLFAWIQNSTPLFLLNSFIVSFLLVMMLEPIRTMVGYFTQRLLTQKHRRLVALLREAQRNLTGVLDPPALYQAILSAVEQTIRPQAISLFVLRSDGTKFRRVRQVEHEPAEPEEGSPPEGPELREIMADHPVIQHFERMQRRGELPILLDQILENEIERSASRSQREHFAALIEALNAFHANLMIPLYDRESERVLGFLALRAPDPPEPWAGNWGLLPIIYPYFEQAAATLRSMEIYVRQREKERLAALGEMAAGLAHEIRNPLGAIKGAAQFLDPTADRPESRFLGIIVEEVDRLNRVVTQFLDYSKPPTTDLRTVDLSDLVEKTLEVLRPGIPPSIRLEFSPPREPARVMANPEQLRQVLINLFQNSVKALEGRSDGSIRVWIETGRRELSVVVEDSGKGIRRDHLDKLFIPFFTTSPSGTGLGLSISQKIVEAHRGRIEVASEEGRFTRFSVVLPVAENHA